MKRLFFFLTLLYTACTADAQNIIIERIKITAPDDKENNSYIPRVKDTSNPNNPIIAKINSYLLETFDLTSFDQSKITEFNWSGVEFEAEVKSGIAYINYGGEYNNGAYPNATGETLYFNLSTGEKLSNTNLPFQTLFSLHGYLDFLSKYWLTTELKDKFKEAVTCAETEPYCSYYDITEYVVEKGKLKVSLDSDCYSRAARWCSPGYSIQVPIDSVKPYLSDVGKKILVDDRYCEKKGVDKFLYNKSVWNLIPKNLYLFGLIHDKYPISMAITIDKTGATTGYYYYDKKKQDLSLKGTYANNILDMTETVNNAATGKFYFTWTDQYNEEAFSIYNAQGNMEYLNGTWLSLDGSKKFKIKFTEVVKTK